MIKIEKAETFGWEAAIRGMRNPKNSWSRSDSVLVDGQHWHLGDNDLTLMQTLSKSGTDHGKFLRMITVYADITAPLYWWKEFDTYKIGTVANSCSTMHKIHAKKFTLDDFSCEHLKDDSWNTLIDTVAMLNRYRDRFNETKDKSDWWQMIQLLPSSYNQKRTVELNYAVLKNMYLARQHHKLDEWHDFCDWAVTLPYFAAICMV